MTLLNKSAIALALLALGNTVNGFSVDLSRRQAIQAAVAGVATAVVPAVLPSNAVVDEETPRIVTRMGGLLVSCLLDAQNQFGQSFSQQTWFVSSRNLFKMDPEVFA